MKRILFFAAFAAATLTSFSQSLNYNDLGVLLSKDDRYGSSRFNAMSGAFGALGSDISSITINPAGGAMARKSKFSVTLGNRNTDYTANYYGNNSTTQEDFFNISQAGGVFVFDNAYNSDWNRFAFTFNYSLKKDFNAEYAISGNSNSQPFFDLHPDSATPFNISQEQFISAKRTGESSVFNVGFSAVHQNKLFVGASLNFHSFQLNDKALLNEINEDAVGNILDAENYVDTYFEGNGVSLGLGFIYKFDHNVRLGLAYETPTWYQEIVEDYYDELTHLEVPNLGLAYSEDIIGPEIFTYSFKAPAKITASGAYVFGKKGLISVDYTYKDYKKTKFKNGNFDETNTSFANNFRGVHALNIGTEWRFDKMSVRGGYHYEKDPNLIVGGNTNSDNIKGFSAGLGYNFGNMTIDLGYTNSENKEFNTIYNTGDLNITNNTSRVTGTITFSL